MSIENKGVRSLANAQASEENENQKSHSYCEDQSAGHLTGEFEHKGEDVERSEKSSAATAGRHVTSAKGGLQVAAERKASNETARKEHQKSWDSDKLTVVPEKKKKERSKKPNSKK